MRGVRIIEGLSNMINFAALGPVVQRIEYPMCGEGLIVQRIE